MNKLFNYSLIITFSLLAAHDANAQAVGGVKTQAYTTLIYKGKVISQDLGCERDGYCSFDIKTVEDGMVDFIWNKGESQPDFTCEFNADLEVKAEKLKPGDLVEVHVRSNANNVLCGDEAAIILLN